MRLDDNQSRERDVPSARKDVFLCYSFDDEHFVASVTSCLNKQPELSTFCYFHEKRNEKWEPQIREAIRKCDTFVLFVGAELGETQTQEVEMAAQLELKHLVLVYLATSTGLPREGDKVASPFHIFERVDPVNLRRERSSNAEVCAYGIAIRIAQRWVPLDGLPVGLPFNYEKDIIDTYARHPESLPPELLKQGCSPRWPEGDKRRDIDDHQFKSNPVPEDVGGGYRPDDARILVDARSADDNGNENLRRLTLREAGPRASLHFPTRGSLRAGVLISGGIAPGTNAVIAGLAERHRLYHEYARKSARHQGYRLEVLGYVDGFKGLLAGNSTPLLELGPSSSGSLADIRREMSTGGSMLGTSRCDQLHSTGGLRRSVQKLVADNVDILYVIGGDGSMRAAHALWTTAQQMLRGGEITREISVIAIPKTMDNDILWVWQSFGFLSAVQEAKETIVQLETEAQSNPRVCVVQLFGSDSGFVVSHAALASGICDAVLIPEVPFSMSKLSDHIKSRLQERYHPKKRGGSPYGVVIMAETAIPTDWKEYIDDKEVRLEEWNENGCLKGEKVAVREYMEGGSRLHGQTPDALRTGGMKIVSRVLEKKIRGLHEETKEEIWKDFRVFTNEPRHLIRSMRPITNDLIFAQRLGVLAVDNAMAGYTDFMVSQWLTEYVLVPLPLVVLGRKRVPKNGMFWKSVLANTGQPVEQDTEDAV